MYDCTNSTHCDESNLYLQGINRVATNMQRFKYAFEFSLNSLKSSWISSRSNQCCFSYFILHMETFRTVERSELDACV